MDVNLALLVVSPVPPPLPVPLVLKVTVKMLTTLVKLVLLPTSKIVTILMVPKSLLSVWLLFSLITLMLML